MRTAEQRFLAKVEVDSSTGCWLWTASTNDDGYAVFGPGVPHRGSVLAHRWSYAYFVGPIPGNLNVLHRCDVPRCVNPEHLFVGTQAENVADCATKGRRNQSRYRKLSPELHEEIARIYFAGEKSQSELARSFGVSQPTISFIVRKHLDAFAAIG